MEFAASRVKRLTSGAKKRKPSASKRTISNYRDQSQEFLDGGEWDTARPAHFVGLFLVLFEYVYKIGPTLVGDDWRGAVSSASRMLRVEFSDDNDKFVDYMRWLWARESGREEWRREHGKPGRVLSWRNVFSGSTMVTEYKIDTMRKAGM